MKFLKCLLIESFIIFYVPEECAWNIISYTVFLFPNSLILFPFKLFLPLLFRFTLLFFSKWNAFYIYFSAFYLVKKKLNFLEYSFSLKWKVFFFFSIECSYCCTLWIIVVIFLWPRCYLKEYISQEFGLQSQEPGIESSFTTY